MAQTGHDGQQRGENGADASQYVFNPMAYNYHQNQNFNPPTVLSQQEANVMADFFDNPDTANANESYLAFGVNANNDNFSTPQVESEDTTRAPAPFASYEFSELFMPGLQQTGQSSSGDAVAGASALLGLSSSQEQSNLLNASNYMTWGNIVGAQALQQSPARQDTTRGQPIKSNSTSQIQQSQIGQNQANTWADIQAQAFQQRTRHSSLQLDTTNTHLHSHQQGWQNAPHTAFPQPVNRSRPPLAKFGSDSRFSPHGYSGQNMSPGDEKNLMHLGMAATPQSATTGVTGMMHRHSITGISPHPHQSSPVSMGHNSAPPYSVDHAFGGQYNGAATANLKRKASQMNESAPPQRKQSESVDSIQPSNDQNGHGHTAPVLAAPASTSSATSSKRRATRVEKAARTNLSEAQKRSNHIQSEQKRRDAMKTNYKKLGELVPAIGSSGSGASRSEILQYTADYISDTRRGNHIIAAQLGISMEQLDEMSDSDDDAN